MINEHIVAERLYTVYCQAVGGKNFCGDNLPTWDEFINDPTKEKQSTAWLEAAHAVIDMFLS